MDVLTGFYILMKQ